MEDYLENMMNSTKEEVGIAQLFNTDQWSPSMGIGGSVSQLDGNPYIFLNALKKESLLRHNRLHIKQDSHYTNAMKHSLKTWMLVG